VTINVAGGGQISVEFEHASAGATLTIDGETHTLGATVEALPE
jgi:DNA-directed RNA polymerase subunit L